MKKHRLLALVLVLLVSAMMLPVQASAAQDEMLERLQAGDFSFFAGTYTPDKKFENGYGGGHPLPDLVLDNDGNLTGKLTSYTNPVNLKPISVTKNKDGSYTCFIRDLSGYNIDDIWTEGAEVYVIFPVGVPDFSPMYEAAGGTHMSYESDTDSIRITYAVYSAGGVMEILYYNTSSSGGFADIPATAYYSEPVTWAVDKGITVGTSPNTFSPEQKCTVAEILTFLWRANGEPNPTIRNPFSDVSESDYYYKPALWAYESGLISGTSFNGGTPCTRSMVVSYLWKLAGQPSAGTGGFNDVPSGADYAQAVSWAVSNGITSGTGKNMFSPEGVCTRSQIVTFLYRAFS